MQAEMVLVSYFKYCFHKTPCLNRSRSVCSGGVSSESSSYLVKILRLCYRFHFGRGHDSKFYISARMAAGGKK